MGEEHIPDKVTPVDFAKRYGRGLQSQLVYYYIRTGKINQGTCSCGRKVIDREQATQFFDALFSKPKK
jgi:hypothetical protein